MTIRCENNEAVLAYSDSGELATDRGHLVAHVDRFAAERNHGNVETDTPFAHRDRRRLEDVEAVNVDRLKQSALTLAVLRFGSVLRGADLARGQDALALQHRQDLVEEGRAIEQ